MSKWVGEVAEKANESLSEKNLRIFQKEKKTIDFQTEKELHQEEWSQLRSLNDLAKLRAVLVSHFSRVTETLFDLLPELLSKLKEKKNESDEEEKDILTLKTDYWNSIVAVGKRVSEHKKSLSPKEKENARKLFGALQVTSKPPIWTPKQLSKVKTFVESL